MSEKQKLIHTGHYLMANQLAWGTSGNISARLDANQMIITASGTHMASLKYDDFVECQIDTGTIQGTKKASKEMPMHLGIYRQREDAKAILHSSPFYTTLFACGDEPILSELFVESMYYLEDIAYIDYYHPGSQELADAVTEQAPHANIIIMRNHGVVVFDDSISEAQMRLETLEMTCRMILKAKETGVQLKLIPEKTVKSFLKDSFYKPRKKLSNKSLI
ncbi:class II aldolase/adducin family protein [Priestia megaterium]|uniref:class II aldolase/adducin family protein n=1 Tax=Priestia megaterium TaxID=1404 RepID=UPI002E24EB47|nr:class II aldolase/adducin family protein [Priestia megaterium]